MKISKQQLQKIIVYERNKVLNENPALLAIAGRTAIATIVGMFGTANGRKTLAKIILALPNLIDAMCDSVFADEDETGQLGNWKTKLCKLSGYFISGPFAISMKIAGELISMLDDDSAKVITDELNRDHGSSSLPDVPPSLEPSIDISPTTFDIDVPTGPESDMMVNIPDSTWMAAESIDRKLLRKMIIQELKNM